MSICMKMFKVRIYMSLNNDTENSFFLRALPGYIRYKHSIQTSICFLLPLLPGPVPGYTITFKYSTHDQGQNQPRNTQ